MSRHHHVFVSQAYAYVSDFNFRLIRGAVYFLDDIPVFWRGSLMFNNNVVSFRLFQPCDKCEAPYGYKNHMPLNSNTSAFSVSDTGTSVFVCRHCTYYSASTAPLGRWLFPHKFFDWMFPLVGQFVEDFWEVSLWVKKAAH